MSAYQLLENIFIFEFIQGVKCYDTEVKSITLFKRRNLDYPFAYRHEEMSKYIDCAIFLDTPLDIAMVRRLFRDMKEVSKEDILHEMDIYLKYARVAYIQMLKDILPSSDYVIDGSRELKVNVEEIAQIILAL